MVKIFREQGDFAALGAAKDWLRENGYSVGSSQRGFAKMTIQERTTALHAASQSIAASAAILRPHVQLFEQFKREQQDMENFGHIFDPKLYRSRERQETAAILEPLYGAAQRLVEAFDAQINAIMEQAGKRAELKGGAPQ